MVLKEVMNAFDSGDKKRRKTNKQKSGFNGRILAVFYDDRDQQNIGWHVKGRTGAFGIFDTKKKAVSKAKRVFEKKKYGRLVILKKNGRIQKVKGDTKASIRSENPFFLRGIMR